MPPEGLMGAKVPAHGELMGIAVSVQGTEVFRLEGKTYTLPTTRSPPLVTRGPILASESLPDGCVCIFFYFFAFFFFPLFYYCFNNNKRARGSHNLARFWRSMGVLGRGWGGSQWGSEVEGEERGELGLAQKPRDAQPPPPLPVPPPPP